MIVVTDTAFIVSGVRQKLEFHTQISIHTILGQS